MKGLVIWLVSLASIGLIACGDNNSDEARAFFTHSLMPQTLMC
jgi:hypothetical protein